ncbi:unnamed protein product [Coffea canephora]|uniref:FAD-binding PCMH-type domain-containing protein n=1 Tax=Coffea canephora TaxID=49390 RepID=A0A068UWB3_COFCA|nr:unnamed protein product [Coffea canephora]
MEKKNISMILLLLFFSSHFLLISSYSELILNTFTECLSQDFESSTSILNILFTPRNSSYQSLLDYPIQNLRYLNSSSTKPLAIVTPLNYSHVQATITCCEKHGLQVRIRSGGHDYEGLSYTSTVSFVILDLQNLRSISVDLEEKSAWVESGASVGELYYWIAQRSPSFGFPAGICPTVGVGGHFSGGGFGTMIRTYGLAADNILDAVIIDVKGRILDRKSMGEDLFWAIRGGGGSSFGVIVAWKIKLLYVPQIVTVFSTGRTLAQGATDLVYKWQHIGHKLPQDLFIRVVIEANGEGGNRTIRSTFNSLFLGRIDKLVDIMKESFPELGLRKEDCIELSWIESALYFWEYKEGKTIEALRDRVPEPKSFFKATSDFVKEPLSHAALEQLWKWCLEEEKPIVIFDPFGGRMDEIPESEIPFPHRKGNLFNIQYLVKWDNQDTEASERHINWIRRLYKNMTPYASKGPRSAYFNYRDLDFGVENISGASFVEAKKWGDKYFSGNFRRLAIVKGEVDPQNFFSDEQSIPPLICPSHSILSHQNGAYTLDSCSPGKLQPWSLVASL